MSTHNSTNPYIWFSYKATSISNLGCRRRWVIKFALWPIYPYVVTKSKIPPPPPPGSGIPFIQPAAGHSPALFRFSLSLSVVQIVAIPSRASAFYGTRSFTEFLTTAQRRYPSQASRIIQSISSLSISLRFILILSFHLRQCPKYSFPFRLFTDQYISRLFYLVPPINSPWFDSHSHILCNIVHKQSEYRGVLSNLLFRLRPNFPLNTLFSAFLIQAIGLSSMDASELAGLGILCSIFMTNWELALMATCWPLTSLFPPRSVALGFSCSLRTFCRLLNDQLSQCTGYREVPISVLAAGFLATPLYTSRVKSGYQIMSVEVGPSLS
jgi:hypothetical protein